LIVDTNVALDHPVYSSLSQPDNVKKLLERDGVDRAVVSSWRPLSTSQFEAGNEFTAAAVRKYPNDFIGFALINPFKPEMTKFALEKLNLRGIRLMPNYFWYYPDYPPGKMETVLSQVAKSKVPVNISVTPERPTNFRQVDEFSDRYPDVRFIIGQIWIPYFWPTLTTIAKKHDNVLMEVGPTTTRAILDTISLIGSDRLLLGSGTPVTESWAVIQHIKGLPIDDKDKQNILGLNAERLLGLP
jgi:predicted TIM-barrel fold metal-dependent hydrolase